MPLLPTTARLRPTRASISLAGVAMQRLEPSGGTRRGRCQLTLLSGNTVNSAR